MTHPPGARLRIHRFVPFTRAEGPGERACLWVQGCPIRCAGCAVPWTWDADAGEWMDAGTIEALLESSSFAALHPGESPVATAWGVEETEAERIDPAGVRP